MAIQQSKMNQVKTDAAVSVARAKARAAQVTANVQVLKAKSFIKRAQSQGKQSFNSAAEKMISVKY